MPSLPRQEEECFFIAPIGKDGSAERNRSDGVLEFVVARAAQEVGLQAVRGDQIAEPGQITLQVIEHVLGAKAAVADLTGLNPNVYYELAIRHTARLPTVLIAEQGEHLPFDIAQMRTIFFSHTDLRSADHCRVEIVRHLRQALDGAVDSPIAASIDLQRLQAGNTVERGIAELVTSMSDLEKGLNGVRADVRNAIHIALSREAIAPYEAVMELARDLERLNGLAAGRHDPELEEVTRKLRRTAVGLVQGRTVPSQSGTSVDLKFSRAIADLLRTHRFYTIDQASKLEDSISWIDTSYPTPAADEDKETPTNGSDQE